MYCTYNGWKLKGRVVCAGERGCFRNEYGDVMFHRDQTMKRSHSVTTHYDNFGNVIRRTYN